MIVRALALLAVLIVSAVQPNCCAQAAPAVAETIHAHGSQHEGHAAGHDGAAHRPADDGTAHHPAGTAACVMALGLAALSVSDLAAPSIESAPTPFDYAHRVEGMPQGPTSPPPKPA